MINCLDIAKNTAWDCRVIDSGTLELSTPVTFYDGSAVPVYVLEMGGGAVEITDDGGFKEHLATCGLDAALDTRRLSTLERAVSKWGVSFDESLSMIAKEDELQYAFQRYLGALFDAARWQLDILKLPPDNSASWKCG